MLVLAFALVGAAAGPRWNPEPVTTTLQPESASVAVGDGSDPVGTYETTSRTVEVVLDGATTDVLIVEPVGLTSPAPAVVFLHGAGTGAAEAFAEHAQAFASSGVVAVSPSKRLDTYSTAHRDYVAMAADYARTLAMARELPSVDADRVGLYAESEGAWIAPILASSQPDDVAFLALVSAPVVSPRQQGAFAVDAYLRNVGVPQAMLRAIPRATGARLPGGILAYADFDVIPYLEQLPQPIFMGYGTDDASMPTVQGPQIVMTAVPGGADQVLLRYYDGANHGIRIGSSTAPVVPAFLSGLATWMLDPAAAQEIGPAVAGATPVQVHLASSVPAPRWYADGEMLLRVPAISLGVLGAGIALLVVSAAVARVRGTRAPVPGFARSLGVFVLATFGVLVALVAYVLAVAALAFSYSTNGWIVWGGWVLLQLVAVVSAWCGVLAVRRLLGAHLARGRHDDAVRAGRAPRAEPVLAVHRELGGWVVVLGCVGLLVVAAYWGAFSPIS